MRVEMSCIRHKERCVFNLCQSCIDERLSELNGADIEMILQKLSFFFSVVQMRNLMNCMIAVGREDGMSPYDVFAINLATISVRKDMPIRSVPDKMINDKSFLGIITDCNTPYSFTVINSKR